MTKSGYTISDQQAMYFVTFQVVNWVDLFSRLDFRDILLNTIKYYQKEQGLKVYAFVIMTNHAHLILSASIPKYDLSTLIGNIKRYSTKQIISAIESGDIAESRKEWMLEVFRNAAGKHARNTTYQIWTHENHPILLDSEALFYQRMDYIHNNPVEAGIVNQPEHYIYSSACYFADLPCLLKIDLLQDYNRSII